MINRLGFLAGLLVIALPAAAQNSDQSLFDGLKQGFQFKFAPGKPGTPGGAPPAKPVRVGRSDWYQGDPDEATSDDNASSREKTRFEEGQNKTLMDACRSVNLTVNQELLLGNVLAIGGQVGRSMERYANGHLAYIDEFSPKTGIGYTPVLWSDTEGQVGENAGVYLGADITGQSFIVRPVPKGVSSCKQLLKNLNVASYKTVLPAKAKRFHDMEVGELWKMGLAFKFGFQPAVAAGSQYVSVLLYWGEFHENRENLSIYRMDKDKLRLRLRLDKANIENKGGSVVGSLTPDQLGTPIAKDLFEKALGSTIGNPASNIVNRAIVHNIINYLRASVDVSDSHRVGEMMVLEFVLDPNNQTEMELVAKMMKGDFLSLKALAKLVHPKEGPDVVGEQGRLDNWKGDKKEELGKAPSFSGIDKYKRDGKGFHFKIPIIWDHQTTWNKSDEKITVEDAKGTKLHVYQTERRGSNKFLEIPILGSVTTHDKWRSAQTFTSKEKNGSIQTPAVMYVHQDGFHHETASSARNMAKEANDIMKLVGTKGNGVNQNTSLPIDEMFPQQPAPKPSGRNQDSQPAPMYRSATSALTVVFDQKAVQDIVHASKEEIVKCYYNAMKTTADLDLADLSAKAAMKVVGNDNRAEVDGARAQIASLAKTAAKIVTDLANVAAAKTPEEQAAAFSRVLAGAGESGLAYENILKVFVQMIDPLDISAEFYAKTDKHIKGEKDVKVRYILNDRKVSDDKLLGEMLQARKRFVEPTKLTD